MSGLASAVYVGKVVHRRLRPMTHHMQYNVASLLIDVDQIEGGRPSLLAYNRLGLFGLDDRDHGDAANPRPIREFAWDEMRKAGAPADVTRVMMLSYPRILGYTFNPLTVLFGLNAAGDVRMVIYEVHNTFGGRQIYPTGPFAAGEDAFGTAEKTFRVSPFNPVQGQYGLKVSRPDRDVAVGVSLSDAAGPVLKAYFTGQRRPLSNRTLLGVFVGLPLMTFKVMAAIHWEALKLMAKGLKLHSP